MTDIKINEQYSLQAVTMDWLLLPVGTLDVSEELATAGRVALGTDSLASVDDILPDPDSTDRRGWWGDLDAKEIWDGWPIGCKCWLLSRAKISDAQSLEGATLARARTYVIDALQPFVDKHLASGIEANATLNDIQTIEVDVQIYRGPLQEIDLMFQLLWE